LPTKKFIKEKREGKGQTPTYSLVSLKKGVWRTGQKKRTGAGMTKMWERETNLRSLTIFDIATKAQRRKEKVGKSSVWAPKNIVLSRR